MPLKNTRTYELNNSKPHAFKNPISLNKRTGLRTKQPKIPRSQKIMPLKKRTNLRTKQLKNARPRNLKTLQLILQNTTREPTPSSENNGVYSGNLPHFTSFQTSLFVYFCVDYPHLAPFYLSSLVVSPLLFTANYPLLATKMPLFKVHFAPFNPCFNGSKRFCLYHLQ